MSNFIKILFKICLLGIIFLIFTGISFKQIKAVQYNYEIPLSTSPKSLYSVEIKNTGENKIYNPKIIANKAKDWSNIYSIVDEVIDNNLSDKEKAMKLWEFIIDNIYHWYPADPGFELHDPIKLFNIYGYGFCDESALALEALCEASGVPGRIWYLEGHVVAEIYYEGDWHLMDPDHRVYYLERDNKTIASIEDCIKDPYLIERVCDENGNDPAGTNARYMASLYTTTENNVMYDNSYSIGHQLNFVLRPGESLIKYLSNEKKFYNNWIELKENYEPPIYGNGKIIYSPPLNSPQFLQGVFSQENIQSSFEGNPSPKIHLGSKESSGNITFYIDSPYVILEARIEGRFYRKDNSDILKIYISPDKTNNEKLLWTADKTGYFNHTLVNADCFNGFNISPKYKYYLRFELFSKESSTNIGIENLKFITTFQIAPKSLPSLVEGTNQIEYCDQGVGDRSLEIIFTWLTDSDSKREHRKNISVKSEKNLKRIEGETRYETAVAISKEGWEKSEYVILARGDEFPDALCASPLCAIYNAPLLINPPDSLRSSVEEEIRRLKASKIILLASEDALSQRVEEELINKLNFSRKNIIRLGGFDRYETSALIADYILKVLPLKKNKIIITTGENFPDAISASPLAMIERSPLLLVTSQNIPQSIQEIYRKIQPEQVIIVGGEDVISNNFISWFNSQGSSVGRIWSNDYEDDTRYTTSRAVGEYLFKKYNFSPSQTSFSYGENFPDSLCLGPLNFRKNSSLLLVREPIDKTIREFLNKYRNEIDSIILAGGNDVLSDELKNEINNIVFTY